MADRTVLIVPRRRWLPLAVVVVLAAFVVAAATAVAKGLPQQSGDVGRYRTALVSTGSVQQTLTLTGTATRVGQVTVGFPMSGTVATVDVAVGDQVSAGQRLATMDARPLEQAVLDAQASLDQAQATWESDQAAASATASSTTGSSSSAAGAATGSGVATPSAIASASTPGVDLTAVRAAAGKVATAQSAADTACAAWLGTGSSSTAKGSSSGTSPDTSTSTQTSTSTDTSTSTQTSTSTETSTSTQTSTSTETSTSTATTSTTATSAGGSTPAATQPTTPSLAACQAALGALTAAQREQGQALTAAVAALGRAASASGVGASASGSAARTTGTSTGSSSTSGTSVARSSSGTGQSTEARLILDASNVTTAEAALAKAQSQRDAAVLTSPTAGVVGSSVLSAGGSANPGSGIVLVTPGAVNLTLSVPLGNLPGVAVGQRATVTPPGGTALVGSVASIAMLPNSTSSSTPAYDVLVTVAQAGDTLSTGAKASVSIATSRVDGVLTVPVSAVTAVATGTGSVGVLKDGVVTATVVRTGAVGQGRIQILTGVAAGDSVVLADAAAALPTNGTGGFNRGIGGGAAGGIAGVGGNGAPGGGAVPGAAIPGGGRPGG